MHMLLLVPSGNELITPPGSHAPTLPGPSGPVITGPSGRLQTHIQLSHGLVSLATCKECAPSHVVRVPPPRTDGSEGLPGWLAPKSAQSAPGFDSLRHDTGRPWPRPAAMRDASCVFVGLFGEEGKRVVEDHLINRGWWFLWFAKSGGGWRFPSSTSFWTSLGTWKEHTSLEPKRYVCVSTYNWYSWWLLHTGRLTHGDRTPPRDSSGHSWSLIRPAELASEWRNRSWSPDLRALAAKTNDASRELPGTPLALAEHGRAAWGGGHVCETVWTSSEGALERFKTDKGVYLWRPPKTSGKNKNTDFIHGAREVPLLKYKPTNFLLQVAQDWVSMSPPIIASLW